MDWRGLTLAKRRKAILLSLAVLVPLGVFTKIYEGPVRDWVNDYLGGVFYVIFWCLVVLLLLPNARPRIIAGSVFAVTCILEFLQLWHPPLLEYLRSHALGATLLGTTFSWHDFPYYVTGSGLGWLWLRLLGRRYTPLGQEAYKAFLKHTASRHLRSAVTSKQSTAVTDPNSKSTRDA